MTSDEPTRLMDAADVSEDVRALLREAAPVPPMTSADRAAILAPLLAPAPAPAPSPPPAPAAPIAVKPLLIASAAVIAIGAVVALVIARRPEERAVSAPPPAVTSVRAEASAVPEEVPSAVPEEIPIVTPSAKPPASRATARPRSPMEDTLGAENALIRSARGKLDAAPADALAPLEEHARRFPSGSLAPERDFLFIKALRRLGRVDEARARARVYAKKHPSSPYAPAVATILAELGGP